MFRSLPALALVALTAACTTQPAQQPQVTRMAFTPVSSSCSSDPGVAAEQMALLAEINRERQAAGLGRVGYSRILGNAAHAHACDQARIGAISHFGPDGSRPGQRAMRAGYDYHVVTENLGLGFHSAGQAMFYWMRSPGHRKNVLNPMVKEAALGLTVTGSGQRAWVLLLGKTR